MHNKLLFSLFTLEFSIDKYHYNNTSQPYYNNVRVVKYLYRLFEWLVICKLLYKE